MEMKVKEDLNGEVLYLIVSLTMYDCWLIIKYFKFHYVPNVRYYIFI